MVASFIGIIKVTRYVVVIKTAMLRFASIQYTAAKPCRMRKIWPETIAPLLVKARAAIAVTVAAYTLSACERIFRVAAIKP